MSHECPKVGCMLTVPDHQLMCRTHWFMVPKALRSRVWETYKTAPLSDEHRDAMRDAIRSVNSK